MTVASENYVSLAISPCQEKTQTGLHTKGKDVVYWESVLNFLTMDIKEL